MDFPKFVITDRRAREKRAQSEGVFVVERKRTPKAHTGTSSKLF